MKLLTSDSINPKSNSTNNINNKLDLPGINKQSAATSSTCPKCAKEGVRRSAKYSTDNIFRKQLYSCYRCQLCGFRFWKMKRSTSVRLSWLFFFIVVTSGALGFLSREIKPSAETTAVNALNNIRDRAAKGDSYAELQMGLRYANGNGVPKDDKQAFQWLEKAANKNQIEAQYRLGMALLEGRGTEKNLKTAFYWIEQSAQHGNAKAQLSLGDMYGSGMGVEISKDRAYLWFSLAAAQGMEKAIYARDLLAHQLDLNQLSAIDQEAQLIKHNQSARD